MDPARLQAVEAIFHAALEVEPDRLPAFLDERCAGDASLRHDVETLLAAHEKSGGFIETPIATLDDRLFEDDEDDRLIGQVIGHWEILKRIGSGGMGAVYLARRADRQYEQQVAIKLIKRGMDTEAVLRRFRNERQILAGFDHPNIARLLDGDTTEDGLPYFVMEYVAGVPIDEYCDERGLSLTARLELFRQVCAAVSYAHRRAVIHRDLKPSNILVGADGVPKLLDFGIARLLQAGDADESPATMIEQRVMTPDYASPEHIRGEPVTTASDVYSLGVVLYRLLTGQLPYRLKAKSAEDLARTISHTEPQRPSAVIDATNGRRLRGDLDNIVLVALRKEPERRYPSVEQFSEDIRRHLASLPVVARPDTLAYRAGKFVRRNTAASVAAALVVLSLVGGLVMTSWQAQRAREQEAIALKEKARAEHRFNEVRQLAHSVLFDYHDAIKDLPGATAVRQRLLDDGLVYLDELAAEAGGDPSLQRELAAAYERLGDVRGRPFSASLGDVDGALDSYSKALRIREALVVADPRDALNRRDLARSYLRISNQLMQTSEAARSIEYLRKALAIDLELSAERPVNTDMRRDLAATYDALGFALEGWLGDGSGALENHRKALSLRQELVATDPGDQALRRDLSFTHVNIGRALFQSGDTQGALESNRKGLAVRTALSAEDPTNADYRRLLAISYQNDGKYRALLNDVSGALQSFHSKLSLDEQLLADDPVNAQTREDLGYSYERIADLLAESGDHVQALSYYRKSLTMYQEVLSFAPHIWRVPYRAIFAHAGIGRMEAMLGNEAHALTECRKAAELLNGIAENRESRLQSAARAQIHTQLAKAYGALAAAPDIPDARQLEHLRAAHAEFVRSQSIWQEMQELGILTGEYAVKPGEVARAIAEVDGSLRMAIVASGR